MELQDLKVGDTVILDNHPYKTVETVAKVTETMIIISGGTRFRRGNGDLVNKDKWERSFIRPSTPEEIKQIQDEKKKDDLATKLKNSNWGYFSLEVLEQIAGIRDAYIEQRKAAEANKAK